jgi:hypothetical protein
MNNRSAAVCTMAVIALVAGCGTAASDGHAGGPGTPAADSSPSPADTPSVDLAVTPETLATSLLNQVRVPVAAEVSGHAPASMLARPPDGPGASNSVIRQHWWRISAPWTSVYGWISRHHPGGLVSMGSTASSGPALDDNERAVDYMLRHVPAAVHSADLSIAVVPLSPHTSAIGAFATVVPQPPRPAAEDVPLPVDSVVVTTSKTTGLPDGGQIIARKRLSSPAATRLVRDFNALRVQPPGEMFSCPLILITQTVAIQAAGHHWWITDESCSGLGVSRDGVRLPPLQVSPAFGRDLRSAYGKLPPSLLHPVPMTPRMKEQRASAPRERA